jgi:hypothetical protein
MAAALDSLPPPTPLELALLDAELRRRRRLATRIRRFITGAIR